jgi:hypothetical protein
MGRSPGWSRTRSPLPAASSTWGEILSSRLEGATRVRVLDGSCDPSDKDRLLFEVDDPSETGKLIANLAFDNRNSGGYCMCGNGDIALVFFAGDQTLGRMGVKHAFTRLLWPGTFPGEGQLTGESVGYLAAWLEGHGFTGALEARAEKDESYGPARRRYEKYRALLSPRVLRSIENDWDAEVLRTFTEEFPDPGVRARLLLELLGIDEGSWHLRYGLDHDIIGGFLPTISPPVLSKAILESLDNPRVLRGAARWLLGEQKYEAVDEAALAKVLPAVGRNALASPRRGNRQRAMTTLARIGETVSKQLLEEVAAGRIEPRPLPESDAPESDWDEAPWVKDFTESPVGDADYARSLLDKSGD